MTSIFNTYYSRNIDRLNSSFEPAANDQPDRPAPGKPEFAQVLADVEHPKPKVHAEPHQPHAPPVFHESARSMLTNIPSEAPSQHPGLPQPGFTVEPSAPPANALRAPEARSELPKPVEGPGLQNVKFGPPRVNALPDPTPVPGLEHPAPPPPSAPAPPAMPHIAEYHRVDEGSGPPAAPSIAALRRFEVMSRPPTATARAVPPHGAHAAEPDSTIKEIVTTAGRFYGIDPNLGLAVAQVESSYDSDAVSHDGHNSKGLFQLLDSTGRRMHRTTGLGEAYDPFDPAQNAYLGMAYLRHLHDIFSSETKLTTHMRTVPAGSAEHVEKLAVAAFNAGEGNVARAQARAHSLGKDPSDYHAIEPYLPASTRRYVQRVTTIRDQLALSSEPRETAKV